MLRIRAATAEDFEAAREGDYAYGYLVRQKELSVLITCGREENYGESRKDNNKTQYKLFKGCLVKVAENDEELDSGKYETLKNMTVVLYF